ncbi:MAG: NAD-dependent epimerase [Cyanobium sp. CACIAM 14]|nr:MAG: NAD-dependent epimerase [Cyanobium sp. CACIAM 14]
MAGSLAWTMGAHVSMLSRQLSMGRLRTCSRSWPPVPAGIASGVFHLQFRLESSEQVDSHTLPTEIWRDRRVLITGGAGFIGSTLAIRLASLGSRVTVIDSLIPEYGGNLFNLEECQEKIRINYSDIRDPYSLRPLIKDVDVLFSLAGQTSHMDSMADPYTDANINCTAQLNLLETCRSVNPEIRIVFASTRQIYGRPRYLPVDEHHPIAPVDINGIHKYAAEQYYSLYSQVYGIQACILRLTNTIGPRMRIKDARQTFVGVWIRQLMEGAPIDVWGGDQLRDFNDVEDVVDAMLIAALSASVQAKVFNLGSTRRVSLRELAEMMIALHGSGELEIREFPGDRRRIDIGDYYSSHNQFSSLTGWSPRITLEETLERTISFYQRHYLHYL